MPRIRAQRIAWWPLALLAFCLLGLTSLTLAIGAAHADDSAPAASSESPTGPTGPVGHVDPVSTDPADGASTPETAKPAAVSPTTSPTKPATKPRRVRGAHLTTVRTATSSPEALEPSDDETPASPPRHRRLQLAAARTATLVAPKAVPQTELVGSGQRATTATNVVSLPTAQPSRVRSAATGQFFDPKFVQFVRQMVGLASDIGVIGASLVNNLAADTAAFIGPKPFFGVPYAVATTIAKTAGNVSKVLSGTPLDATSTGPFKVDYGVIDVLSFLNPTKVPAGANDSSIGLSKAHPLPVILLNGTIETQALNWSVGAPVLANAGYKVYTFNYGNVTTNPNFPIQSIADIRLSAAELSHEIDMVLDATGAKQVILVGHSQGGGILPEYYINQMDGAGKVAQLIGIAPSNHGTDFNGLVGLTNSSILDAIAPALGQQSVTSPFQQVVYGGGDTRDGVRYTTIASTHDEVVTPYTQQALVGPAVTNIVVQDRYPRLATGHVGVAFIPQVWDSVLAALAGTPATGSQTVDELLAA